MRICLYTATALPKLGGQEFVVDALATELTRLGHIVTVLAQNPRRPLTTSDDAGRPYRVIRHPRYFSTRWGVAWYQHFLRRAAKAAGGFDVIHAHDVYPTGYIAVLTETAPVVITSHGGDLNEGNVRIVKPGVEERCRIALERAASLISIGRFTTANFCRLSNRLPPITDIPNGVHVGQLATGPSSRPAELAGWTEGGGGGAGWLLYLGRLHPRKGVDVLLRGMSMTPGALLAIAGDGEERAALGKLADALGVSARVRFLGRRTGEEKTWLLQNAQAVVMPSRGWEAFPLVVLEAAAASRPVVASRIPGLEDLVEDQVTGRLVAPENPAELAGALRQVLSGTSAAAWGAAARARVPRYDWSRVAVEHLSVYQAVIDSCEIKRH